MSNQRSRCCTCGSPDLLEVADLGMHPMADTFVPADRKHECDRIYPLICDLCVACKQVQLRTITDPAERYSHYDYSYTSSNSAFSRNHWNQFAVDVPTKVGLATGDTVVEIGSNDGYLCEQLMACGYKAHGVDPSPAMARLAAARGVRTSSTLFSNTTATQLVDKLVTKPRLIIANNVFNHANDPLDFAHGVKALLAHDGTFVFELPYWLRTVIDGKFDQIYHEHVSYFTVVHTCALFSAVGMVVTHASEVDYHGGSIRVFVKHQGDPDESVRSLVSLEEDAGLFDPATYSSFMNRVRTRRDEFLSKVFQIRNAGKRIICAGAAAKANTFMSYYGLNASIVDWVTDSSPTKIGKFTPATRVPIVSDEIVKEYGEVFVIITSWNLAPTLKRVLTALNPEVRYLDPYEV